MVVDLGRQRHRPKHDVGFGGFEGTLVDAIRLV